MKNEEKVMLLPEKATIKMKIRFYDVQFLYLTDKKYYKEYNEENNLSAEQIQKRMDELQVNCFEIVLDETAEKDIIDLLEDEETEHEMLDSLLQDECGEYFTEYNYDIETEYEITEHEMLDSLLKGGCDIEIELVCNNPKQKCD
jgi:hypothetical protein